MSLRYREELASSVAAEEAGLPGIPGEDAPAGHHDGRAHGPFDIDTVDPGLAEGVERLDFGSVRVPVPPDGEVAVEPTNAGRLQAVHITVPGGRLSVSALAAPRSAGLWKELCAEIETSLREGGARVRTEYGEWGRELHARTQAASSVFVGVDGDRWMVYGVASGSSERPGSFEALDAELRRMLRGTVVVRGKAPYPPRTVLPLTLPPGLRADDDEADRPRKATLTLRTRAAAAKKAAAPAEAATAEETVVAPARGPAGSNGAGRPPGRAAPVDGPGRSGGTPAAPPARAGQPGERAGQAGPGRPPAGAPPRPQDRPAARLRPGSAISQPLAAPAEPGRPAPAPFPGAAPTGPRPGGRPQPDAPATRPRPDVPPVPAANVPPVPAANVPPVPAANVPPTPAVNGHGAAAPVQPPVQASGGRPARPQRPAGPPQGGQDHRPVSTGPGTGGSTPVPDEAADRTSVLPAVRRPGGPVTPAGAQGRPSARPADGEPARSPAWGADPAAGPETAPFPAVGAAASPAAGNGIVGAERPADTGKPGTRRAADEPRRPAASAAARRGEPGRRVVPEAVAEPRSEDARAVPAGHAGGPEGLPADPSQGTPHPADLRSGARGRGEPLLRGESPRSTPATAAAAPRQQEAGPLPGAEPPTPPAEQAPASLYDQLMAEIASRTLQAGQDGPATPPGGEAGRRAKASSAGGRRRRAAEQAAASADAGSDSVTPWEAPREAPRRSRHARPDRTGDLPVVAPAAGAPAPGGAPTPEGGGTGSTAPAPPGGDLAGTQSYVPRYEDGYAPLHPIGRSPAHPSSDDGYAPLHRIGRSPAHPTSAGGSSPTFGAGSGRGGARRATDDAPADGRISPARHGGRVPRAQRRAQLSRPALSYLAGEDTALSGEADTPAAAGWTPEPEPEPGPARGRHHRPGG